MTFTVTAAFESLQPRAQDLRRREDAMCLASELSRVSPLEVLVTPRGTAQPTCIYQDGKLVHCLCPGGAP